MGSRFGPGGKRYLAEPSRHKNLVAISSKRAAPATRENVDMFLSEEKEAKWLLGLAYETARNGHEEFSWFPLYNLGERY